jgi:2-haloacid dehalogenase
MSEVQAIVFDVGRVIVQWDLRCLFGKLIADERELEWFVSNVVTEEWHFQQDEGRDLAEMVAERKLQFPDHMYLIDAYATRFPETIPGLIDGTPALVERLKVSGVPLFALTNFGAEFWDQYRPTEPLFDHFRDVVVSGVEKVAKPDPRIYEIAESRFGHNGPGLFFIDDNPANIAAAEARGWQGHLFTGAARLEEDLVVRGLL